MAISVENRKFSRPRVFCAPAEGVPLGKSEVMALTGREWSLMISSAVWIQYTNVPDGQTDGRTDTDDSKDRAYA